MSCRLNKASEVFGCHDDDWCLLNVTTCQIYLKSLQNLGKFTVYQGLCESHALAECRLNYSVLGHCPCLNVEAVNLSLRRFLRLYSNPTGLGIIYLQTNHYTRTEVHRIALLSRESLLQPSNPSHVLLLNSAKPTTSLLHLPYEPGKGSTIFMGQIRLLNFIVPSLIHQN